MSGEGHVCPKCHYVDLDIVYLSKLFSVLFLHGEISICKMNAFLMPTPLQLLRAQTSFGIKAKCG